MSNIPSVLGSPSHLATAIVVALLGASGCAPMHVPADRLGATHPRRIAGAEGFSEARELREGRAAWCGYVQSVYLRVQPGATSWPRFDECVRTPTTGSAAMLKATAACSMRVLASFDGDPLSPEYAERARFCGAEALDHTGADQRELARITSAICGHAAACGAAPTNGCAARVEATLGPHLDKVLGALNESARARLDRCIVGAQCGGDVTEDITGCIEPIMDRLLYQPNDA